jgi:hypothetical protein
VAIKFDNGTLFVGKLDAGFGDTEAKARKDAVKHAKITLKRAEAYLAYAPPLAWVRKHHPDIAEDVEEAVHECKEEYKHATKILAALA